MKLIDVLVRDLDKFGGWPEGAAECHRFADESIIDFFDKDGNWPYDCTAKYGSIAIECVNPRVMGEGIASETVTRKQYEEALSARKTEWDGDGLPPVGCRVEANYGGEWVEATVAYTERPEAHGDAVAWKEVLVFDSKTTRPFWTDEFRPIRSEADKKRDESIKALKFSFGAFDVNGLADMVYQAIASGKIPHIRIN